MSDTPPDAAMTGLLRTDAVRLNESAADRTDAVRRCGAVLVEIGAVEPAYIDAMLERERDIPTYVGEGVAIPHATLAGKQAVLRDALAVVKLAEPVDWDGNPVSVCVAIAARGDGHLAILSELAEILLDPDRARDLREARDPDEVVRLLQPTAAS
ncbi:MAG TPA: PTS sugar transporter subunit IIA [Actinocrinis sp.]|nr:PTS sugar transporter subunit IIA [Actinocrinis sp.]HZP50490.1 PTS sugar transporter subunit IIA [Actinocrinis sp.]